jgi:hypothetical protein
MVGFSYYWTLLAYSAISLVLNLACIVIAIIGMKRWANQRGRAGWYLILISGVLGILTDAIGTGFTIVMVTQGGSSPLASGAMGVLQGISFTASRYLPPVLRLIGLGVLAISVPGKDSGSAEPGG